jgi:squalene cyclase
MNTNQPEKYSIIEDIRVDENGGLSSYPDAFMDEWTNQLLKLM